MKFICPLIITVIIALLIGCNEAKHNPRSENTTEVPKSMVEDSPILSQNKAEVLLSKAEILPLMIGIYTDGTPFFDWTGAVQYSHQANGSLNWDEGANLKGDFKRLSDGATASIDVQVKIEQENYLITGSYSSSVPFTLSYLGTAEDVEEAVVTSFAAGEGSIKYRGDSPYTFEKE